jgi:hypothetical protein
VAEPVTGLHERPVSGRDTDGGWARDRSVHG